LPDYLLCIGKIGAGREAGVGWRLEVGGWRLEEAERREGFKGWLEVRGWRLEVAESREGVRGLRGLKGLRGLRGFTNHDLFFLLIR